MYEVILYAAIATVVCVMFYSILGKSVGKGPDEGIDPEQFMAKAENKKKAPVMALSSDYNSLGLGEISANVEGNAAFISVQYEADLTSALLDGDGNVVQGDPDVLSSITEVWTFTRSIKSSDPTWRLCEVEASEGDDLEADPTPDTKPST